MDFLLVFYYLLFGLILFLPFLIFYFRFKEEVSPFGRDESEALQPLLQKKRNLLDSLKDVRSDFDSGKLSEEEFQSQSIPYIQALDEIESSLEETKSNPNQKMGKITAAIGNQTASGKFAPWNCHSCGFSISIPNAKFCPNCGASMLA